jgi:hypothetical protein
MPQYVQTADITQVDTTRQHDLGSLYLDPQPASVPGVGPKVYIYVFNDEAATAFAVGDIVVRDPSATTETLFGGLIAAATNAASNMVVLGVSDKAIAAGSYGWIQCQGKCVVKNGTGNITADTAIVSGGSRAGSAKDATGGTDDGCVFGVSLEAEATDDTTFDAWINCRGAGL